MKISEISVTIYDIESVIFQGSIKALTSLNDKGPFDILPLHSNFISLIKEYIILRQKNGSDKEFKFRQGVLEFIGNRALVFLGVEGLKEQNIK